MMRELAPLLQVKHLSKTYQGRRTLADRISGTAQSATCRYPSIVAKSLA